MVDQPTQPTNLVEALNQPQTQEPQTEAPQEANPLSEQFNRLSKQEKFVAEERRKIEEARRAFETDKVEVEKYRSLKNKDPFEILEAFGISYNKLLEADKTRRTTPIDPVAKKALETVEQLRAELQNKEKEAEKERHARAEIRLMADIDKTLVTKEFDLIEKLGEQSAVKAYMEDRFNETGIVPDIEEACIAVTNQLVERFSKIKDSKWLKSKEPESIVEEVKPKKEEVLSNKMTQSTIGSQKPMTEKERFKAALQAMAAVGK